jgi:hypothetical protein
MSTRTSFAHQARASRTVRRATLLAAALFGVVSLGDDCDGDIVSDPTFRDWCGNSLCSWTTDSGNISQAPTWNADDLGVSFNQTPTQISQVTDESSATCIQFTSVANVDVSAQMVLEVDFNNDGTIDSSTPIAGNWQQFQTEITAPTGYYGITFHIRKQGTGNAVLAEMRIQSTTGCTAPPPVLTNLPLGDGCGADSECASNVCGGGDYFFSTVNPVCSLCSASQGCSGPGQTCQLGRYGFMQCSPGGHLGVSNANCTTNSDCESNHCDGVVLEGTVGEGDAGDDGGTDAGPCVYNFGSPDAGPVSTGTKDSGAKDGGTSDASTYDAGPFTPPSIPCIAPAPTLVQGRGGVCR